MRAVTIITSAAFVNTEIAAEFGNLPPSFLPIGHGRVYELQLARVSSLPGRVVLTLPQSFETPGWDLSYLHSRGVEILPVPDNLSLGESVLHALLVTGALGPVRILHGDTAFLSDLPNELDCVSVASTASSYSWGAVDNCGRFIASGPRDISTDRVITGYFAFSRGTDFARSLTMARGDFLAALGFYSESCVTLAPRELEGWLDCGHLQTYYAARAHVTTARAFNMLTITRRVVEKQSPTNERKLRNEALWFEQLPPLLRLHTPTFLGAESNNDGPFSYRLAYEHSPTLHELFVFGSLGKPIWRKITRSCFDFLEQCGDFTATESPTCPLLSLVLEKTSNRLDEFSRSAHVDLDDEWRYGQKRLPSLRRIAEIASEAVDAEMSGAVSIMHGDFCFPNLFYDFREEIVKVIDPRGSIDGTNPDCRGDVRYDLAKFNHSLQGYDLILSRRYVLESFGDRDVVIAFPQEGATRWLADLSAEFTVAGFRVSDDQIRALTVHLFLSMLPLHADRPDRQKAFLANALRLFADLRV